MKIQLKKTVFYFVVLLAPFLSMAQGDAFKGLVYRFSYPSEYKPDTLRDDKGNSYPVYSSGETFIDVKSFSKYPSAAKYADMMENGFLDLDDVYTDRKVDTLDGVPVIHLIKEDKRKNPAYIQHFYWFDDGNQTFQISLSGSQPNRRNMEERFQSLKNSFRFDTKVFEHNGIKITLPVIMSTHSTGFWGGCYTKDYAATQIMILANHLPDQKYEGKIKDLEKYFKSLKPSVSKTETFKAGEMNATKFSGTYKKQFKNSSEDRSDYHYVIQHPTGGIFYIWYSDKPGAVDILDKKIEEAIKGMRFL